MRALWRQPPRRPRGQACATCPTDTPATSGCTGGSFPERMMLEEKAALRLGRRCWVP